MDIYIGKTTLGLPVADLTKGHNRFAMNRMLSQHLSGGEHGGLMGVSLSESEQVALKGRIEALGGSPIKEVGVQRLENESFSQMLMNALDGANRAQNEVDLLTQQAIVDPESVDIHEVTIAMAKANMTLSISKAIIDRSISGFKDILNQR